MRAPELIVAGALVAAHLAGCTSSSTISGVDGAASAVTAEAANVALNGSDAGAVRVQLRGAGAARAGLPVSLSAPGCHISPAGALTDGAGDALFTVACPRPSFVEATAHLLIGGLDTSLPRPAKLNFYAPSDGRRAIAPGTAVNLQLVARGPDGAIDTSYRGRVHFESSDPAASLPADLDMTAEMGGVAQLAAGAILRTLGEQTITAADPNRERPLALTTFLVSRGVGQAAFEAPPGTATAGVPLSLTLVGLHDDGSGDPDFAHQVLISSSDPAATLPPPYTFNAAAQGRVTLPRAVTLVTAGTQFIDLTDQQTGVVRSRSLVVGPAPVDHLEVTCTRHLVAGASCPLSIAARDPFGNLVADYAGDVRLTCSDPLAQLPAGATFSPAGAGEAAAGTFVSRASGAVAITATDRERPQVTGTGTISVAPAQTHGLALTLPAAAVAGQPLSALVASADGFGNLTPAYHGSLHFSASHPRTILPGDITLGPADAGQRPLVNAVVVYDAGTEAIRATDLGAPGLTAQATVTVQPAAATRVVLQTGAAQTAGVAADVNVLITDAYGNLCPTFVGAVQLTCDDAAASLPGGGGLTFSAADAGRMQLPGGLVLRTAGSQTLRAQAGAGALRGLLPVQVGPGALAEVSIDNLPADSVVTQPLSPRLRPVDAFGNTLTTFTGVVNLAATPPGTALPAQISFAAADAGSITLADAFVPAATGTATIDATLPASPVGGTASVAIGHGCWSYGGIDPLAEVTEAFFRLSLTMDASSRPAVSWDVGVPFDGSPTFIHALGWDGSGWQRFGADSALPFPDRALVNSRIILDRSNQPLVAASNQGPLFFLRRSGAAWLPLGGSAGPPSAPVSTMVYDNRRGWDIGVDASNRPWAVAEANKGGGLVDLTVLIFDGGAWVSLPGGGALDVGGANTWPALAMDAAGVPTLAWASTAPGNNEVLVARGATVAAGGSWTGPASGGAPDNISANTSTSTAPALALDGAGRPTIAWQDDASGRRQIYLRRFDGAAWQELGGSASGGGISQSSVDVGPPEIALDSQGFPVVTWTEPQVKMRRWSGSAWVEEHGSATGDGVAQTGSVHVPVAVDGQDRAVMFFSNNNRGRVCSWR